MNEFALNEFTLNGEPEILLLGDGTLAIIGNQPSFQAALMVGDGTLTIVGNQPSPQAAQMVGGGTLIIAGNLPMLMVVQQGPIRIAASRAVALQYAVSWTTVTARPSVASIRPGVSNQELTMRSH